MFVHVAPSFHEGRGLRDYNAARAIVLPLHFGVYTVFAFSQNTTGK